MGSDALILLDTHALIWLDGGSSRLGQESRRALDRALAEDQLSVSAITFWEVGTLIREGRMSLARDLDTWRSDLLQAGVVEIAVSGDIGTRATTLEDLHADPADRLIVATALREGAVLYTADSRILAWTGPVQRSDASE